MKLDLELILKLAAVGLWAFGAFGKALPVDAAVGTPVGWHAFLLGLACYAAAPIVGGYFKPKT